MGKKVPFEWLAVTAGIIILVMLLFIRPVTGVADNGDFHRVMTAGGLTYFDEGESYEDRYFGYAHEKYGYGPFLFGSYVSSQIPLVVLAGLLGRVWNGEWFDIRVLASLYSALFLAALFILVKFNKSSSFWFNLALTGVLVVVFADVGYTAYFNSFFGEAATLVFMLLTVGLVLGALRAERGASGLLAAFFLAAALLVSTKLQYAPIGVVIGLLGIRLMRARTDRGWRRTAVIGSAVVLAASIVVYAAAPGGLKGINLYQTVFFGVLKDSPDPARDLQELGLPESLAVNAGTNYFQKDAVIKQNDPRIEEALSKIGHTDVLLYYAKHPLRFVQKLERGAKNGMSVRPYYLGSFDQAEGRGRGALNYAYSVWSEFKHTHVPNRLWFVALFYLLYVGVILASYFKRRRSESLESRARRRLALEVLLTVALIGVFALAVPLVGDGEADLGKHLFLFNVCFDLMAITALMGLVNSVLNLRFKR
ncbi:hypothetical protein [Paenibacillus sp. NPDC058071]|uniref:glycan biosynthesis hexose transferase WsfD n=1 Tax=Paenibacillus sp. NPDC058071 TaxID=3346326 RepID=UPI0036DE18B3